MNYHSDMNHLISKLIRLKNQIEIASFSYPDVDYEYIEKLKKDYEYMLNKLLSKLKIIS